MALALLADFSATRIPFAKWGRYACTILNVRHEAPDELAGLDIEVHIAGDCLGPRTAEEAVFEGLKVATAL